MKANNIDGLRNLHIWGKQLVLPLQYLCPTILEQPILMTSTIVNKMSQECLYKWEEENTKRKRELSLPPPNKHIQWILNWLGDYIHTSKRSIIKMQVGDDKTKNNANGNKSNGNSSATPRTLNNFFTLAEQKTQHEQSDKCIFCNGNHFAGKCRKTITVNTAVEKAMKAKACLNCLKPGHLARDCQISGCKEAGCNGKHHRRVHGGNFKLKWQPVSQESSEKEETVSNVTCFSSILSDDHVVHLLIVRGYLAGPVDIPVNIMLDKGSTVNFISKRQQKTHSYLTHLQRC